MLVAAAPCSLFNPADLTSPLCGMWVTSRQVCLVAPENDTSPTMTIQSIKMLALSLARPVDVTFLGCTILSSPEIPNHNSIPGHCSQGLPDTGSLYDQL